MKEYIFSLHPVVFITIVIIALIAIVIIMLKGKIKAKFGDKIIDIGGDDPEPPPTASIKQKRSCGDCVLLLMGEREKFEFKIRKETNKIMKNQMTFVEQKLIEIQTALLDDITCIINKDTIDESVQYKLIYGLLKDSLHNIKDEIRRSFKDNGFCDLGVSEFSSYLKDRTQILNSMLVQYIRNMYPDRGGVLEASKIINVIEQRKNFLSGLVNDLYMYAREVKLETDKKVNILQEQFIKWVDKFIE